MEEISIVRNVLCYMPIYGKLILVPYQQPGLGFTEGGFRSP